MNNLEIYQCAIYCRLSKEDEGSTKESASIATQKAILMDFVRSKGWNVHDIYIDVYNQRLIPFDTKTAVQTLKITAFEGKVPVESRDFYF